jgi:UDP-N-acetylglucosamine transferase subunit ALG13
MVFVTLGNLKQPFERLLRAVDEAAAGWGGEELLVQAGGSMGVEMRHGRKVEVLGPEEYLAAMERADAVVMHCGAGSLFHAYAAGHVPVVMARRPEYGESIEDQMELAAAVAGSGRILLARDGAEVARYVAEARGRRGRGRVEASRLVGMVERAVRELMGEK